MSELTNEEKARIYDTIFCFDDLTPERLIELVGKANTHLNAPNEIPLHREDVKDLNRFHFSLLSGLTIQRKCFSTEK